MEDGIPLICPLCPSKPVVAEETDKDWMCISCNNPNCLAPSTGWGPRQVVLHKWLRYMPLPGIPRPNQANIDASTDTISRSAAESIANPWYAPAGPNKGTLTVLNALSKAAGPILETYQQVYPTNGEDSK